MIRRRWVLACSAVLAAVPFTASPARVDAASGDLQLISQSFNVAADSALTATLQLPGKLAGTDLTTVDVLVTAYERVESRESLAGLIRDRRQLPPADDSVDIAPGCCPAPKPNQFTVSVPLEVTEVRPDALSLPRAGLYPVVIAVRRSGAVLAEVLTFLNRLPAADESTNSDALAVGVAIATSSTIQLDSNATISVDPASTRREMSALADTLDGLASNAFTATVRVEPSVLRALQQLDPTLFARLIASLQHHRVVLEPRWPLDPSAAAAANQGELYTTWLRDGQEQLRQLGLGPDVISTSTVLVTGPIGAAGTILRRNLGAGLMVMTPKQYDGLKGSIQIFTDYKGELVSADLPNGSSMDVAVVDHALSELLVHPMPTPEMTRIYAVAHLLALRQKVLTDGASPHRHAVVIADPAMGVPDAATLASITSLITATPGLAAATLDDIGFHTDNLIVNGDQQAPVSLPTLDGVALNARVFLQAQLNNEIDAVASMLPDTDDRPDQWRQLAAMLPTSALDDAAAQGVASSIRTDLAGIRDAIQVPRQYTVNLPGRRSTVRLRFLNTADVPLKIKVQLSSPAGKLVFANSPDPVELEPGVPRDIAVAVVARSNGTSGVSLDVSTPNDVPLRPTVALEFRVRALGLGNVLTIVVFALVLLWWLQHIRSTWRRRRRSETATLAPS